MQTVGTAVAPDCLFTPGTGTQSCFEEAEVDSGRATDEALVERARGGDSLAFGELIQRHRGAIPEFGRSYLLCRAV